MTDNDGGAQGAKRDDDALRDIDFAADSTEDPGQRGGSNTLKYLAIGCVVVLVLAFAFGLWLAVTWRTWVPSVLRPQFDKVVAQLELSEKQQAELNLAADRIFAGVEQGLVDPEHIEQIITVFSESPAFAIVPIGMFGGYYIDKSGLSAEEKDEAWLHLHRFGVGIFDGHIPREELKTIGLPSNNEPMTDTELQALIAKMKERADAAEIANERKEFDIAGGLEDAANQVLGEGWDDALEGSGGDDGQEATK